MFLFNEKEEKKIYKDFSRLEPQEFASRIDSLQTEKQLYLENLISEVEFTQGAKEIAVASINYTYYKYKEEYPFRHKRHAGLHVLNNLPN